MIRSLDDLYEVLLSARRAPCGVRPAASSQPWPLSAGHNGDAIGSPGARTRIQELAAARIRSPNSYEFALPALGWAVRSH
jgi:hypothetical protein